MITSLKYLPVNWVDGMKVSREHFTGLENSISDAVRDAISLNITNYNYGLLPPLPGQKKSLDIQPIIDQPRKMIKVKVLSCRAITSNGSRIEISQPGTSVLEMPEANRVTEQSLNDSKELLFDIVIGVNPFSRVPVGVPDSEESPPRNPNTIPDCQVKIVASDRMNLFEFGANHLTVGKLRMVSGEVEISERYFPPCSTVSSYEPLLEIYHEIDKFNNDLLSNCIRIIQKIQSKTERNTISESVYYLSEKMMLFLAMNIDAFRLRFAQMPPIFMIEFIISLARGMRTSIDIKAGIGKEELLNYFNEWSELSPGEFENIMNLLINVEYQHADMLKAIERVYNFTNVVSMLFGKLSQLDYIGKKPLAAPTPQPAPVQQKKPTGWAHISKSKF